MMRCLGLQLQYQNRARRFRAAVPVSQSHAFAVRTGLACVFLLLFGPGFGIADETDFDREIAPLLAQHCLSCHSGAEPVGGLSLVSAAAARKGGESGPALDAANPGASLLWERIAAGEMPPKKSLSRADKQTIRAWLNSGAKWGTSPIDLFAITTPSRAGYDWWALQPLREPEIPNGPDDSSPIDRFVRHRLREENLKPSPRGDHRTLVRRLYFTLVGLPPTIERVRAFEKAAAEDFRTAWDELVSELLGSQHYGERWARHWLDLARFGESQGFERDKLRPDSWFYRDWVIHAFNNNMPYDEFVRQQVAGDVLYPGERDPIIATGFLVAAPYDEVGNSQQSAAMRAVVRQDELEDIVGTVGQSFLGLTVNCARCHDHKFDPIRQAEYYRIASALSGVRHGTRRVLPAGTKAKLAAVKTQIGSRRQELLQIEDRARRRLLAKSSRSDKVGKLVSHRVRPLARWEFERNRNDVIGTAHADLVKGNVTQSGQLILNKSKSGYAATRPLAQPLDEHTLEAWIRLNNTAQRGGAAISIQDPNGSVFDAIVFGEREPGQWMAGSDGYRRTKSFQAGDTEQPEQLVHVAIVWSANGMVTGYRNGKLYGKPYQSSGLKTFAANRWQVIFGLRHGNAASAGRQLLGRLECAQLYDRALSARQIAASFEKESLSVQHADVLAAMGAKEQNRHASLVREIDELEKQTKSFQPHPVYAVQPRPPGKVPVLLRGNPATPGEVVTPGGIRSLSGVSAEFELAADASDGDRRRKLAAWITERNNPLFARVMVNRLWHYHFGRGLVPTPNDFGFNGGRPSHPELLNWLALEFRKSNFDIKHMQRLIVSSATWQQASLADQAAAVKKDADNRLLWRANPRRLDAESLRDSVLAASGELNRQLGGPPYRDFETFNFNSQFYVMKDPIGSEFNRRTIYRTWIRSGRNRFLDVFDCPDPSTTAPQRAVTTTPSQSLSLMNNSFILRMSKHLADLARTDSKEVSRQVRVVAEHAWQRELSAEEVQVSSQFVNEHGLDAFCRVVFNSNEFLYVD